MRPQHNEQVYKLIHSQEMVQYMWRYTMHTQATQIPFSIEFDEDIDFNVLAQAVNVEIERNDCMRLRIFIDGFKMKQYFLDEYRLERIRLKEFSSKEEQKEYFDKDASAKLDVLNGETFRIAFFRTFDGKCGVFLNASHMIMDFIAVFNFFKDLMLVYDSLKNGTPMPKPLGKYEDIVKKEQDNPELEERIAKDTEILRELVAKDGRPIYNAINGPVVLDKQSKLLHKKDLNMPFVYMPFKDSANIVKCVLSDEDSKKISDFINENHYSAEWVIQLGFRIYFSKINRHTNDSLFWVLCPRRKTVKEKRCGGTLASPLPWREILDDNKTFHETVRQLGETQAFLFRHSDVPFTAVRKTESDLFHLSIMQTANSMMFSYLPSTGNSFGDRQYSLSAYNFGHYVMPIYTLAMQDSITKRYAFSYIHRLWLTTDEDVYSFHDGVVRAILAGVTSPEKTIGKILEEI